jgi:6,7-dimethyl-8-ribityllumazine synthase
MKIRIGFVVSEFNEQITAKMLDKAKKHAEDLDADVRYICYVPGTFDMPLMIESLLKKKDIDAVVTLGTVIRGETKHDEIVASNAARLIADLCLRHGKPVTLGISGPDMTESQARDRINAISVRAVTAAVRMTNRIRALQDTRAGGMKVIR